MKWIKASKLEKHKEGHYNAKYQDSPCVLDINNGDFFITFATGKLITPRMDLLEILDESPSTEVGQQGEIRKTTKQQLIDYCYEFAWQWGRFHHLGDAEKIKEAIIERFQLPEEFLTSPNKWIDESPSTEVGQQGVEVIDGYIQIAINRKTLPKDGQRIKFRTDKEDWYEGYFVDGEDLFFVNESTWFAKWYVHQWKYI